MIQCVGRGRGGAVDNETRLPVCFPWLGSFRLFVVSRQSSVVRRECECVFDLDLNRDLGTYLLYDHRPSTSIHRKERARTTSRALRIRLSALATRPLLLLTLILVLVLSPGSWNASVTDRITDLLIPLLVHRHRHCSLLTRPRT